VESQRLASEAEKRNRKTEEQSNELQTRIASQQSVLKGLEAQSSGKRGELADAQRNLDEARTALAHDTEKLRQVRIEMEAVFAKYRA
jgi:chromosome segregation ATPase